MSLNLKPHHTAISVRNMDESVKFYEKLGFKQVHEYVEDDGSMSIIHIKLGDTFIELFCYKKNKDQQPVDYEYANNLEDIGVKHIALATEDIDKSLEDLRAIGLANENTKITVGRTKVSFFFIKDPDGVWVEIVKDDRYE